MTTPNPHLGSTFESWLDEQGIRAEVTTAAIKAVVAFQLSQAMKEKGITKSAMADQMKTSRAQLDRLLDPANGGVTLETLQKAAKVLGRSIRVELV
jgi:antitoxin HicB